MFYARLPDVHSDTSILFTGSVKNTRGPMQHMLGIADGVQRRLHPLM